MRSRTYEFKTGTAQTEFLDVLNAGVGFAGYTDWRLPNAKELQSLVDYSEFAPAVLKDAMGDVLLPGATTAASYWSSTADAGYDGYAWLVNFYNGYLNNTFKDSNRYVRAVRGGR